MREVIGNYTGATHLDAIIMDRETNLIDCAECAFSNFVVAMEVSCGHFHVLVCNNRAGLLLGKPKKL